MRFAFKNFIIPTLIIFASVYIPYCAAVNIGVNTVFIIPLITAFCAVIYRNTIYRHKMAVLNFVINLPLVVIADRIHWTRFYPSGSEGHFTPAVLIFPIMIIIFPLMLYGVSVIVDHISKGRAKRSV